MKIPLLIIRIIGELINLCYFFNTYLLMLILISSQPDVDMASNSNPVSTKRGRGHPKGSKKKSGSANLTGVDIDAHHQGPGRPKQQQPRLTTEVRIVVCIL
jgi:hypothetical protein